MKNTYRVRVQAGPNPAARMTIIRYADSPREAREQAEAEGHVVHGVSKQGVPSEREAFGNC